MVFGAVLVLGILAVANITAVVIKRGDDAETEQALVYRHGSGCTHATVHQARHRQCHVHYVLNVVIIGIAPIVAGVLATIEAHQIIKGLPEIARGILLVQVAVDQANHL